MLRIHRLQQRDTIRFRLEGKLLGPWVDELAATLDRETGPLAAVELDLSEVTFVDAAGTGLLRSLVSAGVRLGERSDFVATLLEVE